MKKIITTLTAVTFALGLAAAAQAQVAKTPEKPAVQNTQTVQPQVAPKEAAKKVTTETVTTGDKTQTVTQTGDKGKAKEDAKKVTTETVTTSDQTQKATQSGDKGKTKQVTKKAEPKSPIEKKAGAPMEKTPEAAK